MSKFHPEYLTVDPMFKRSISTVAILVILVSIHSSAALAQNVGLQGLKVGTWINDGGGGGSSSTTSGAQIQTMFASANNDVLHFDADNAGTADKPCTYTLSMTGSWGDWFFNFRGAGSDGNISGKTEFNFINNFNVYVKIVPTISWCGQTLPGIRGCTTNGARNSVVLTDRAVQRGGGGVTLTHEHGHSVGLNDNTTARNFMNGSGGDDTWNSFVTGTQCTALRDNHIDADGPGGNPASFTAATAGAPMAQTKTDFTGIPIETIARTGFYDTIPVEVVDYYGANDLAKLRKMLADSSEQKNVDTIAVLISLLSTGEEQDADALIALADREPWIALTAITSLGFVAEKGSQRALNYLLNTSKTSSSPSKRDAAIAGLGLSGKPQARAVLNELSKKSTPSPSLRSGTPEAPLPAGAARQAVSNSAASALDFDLIQESVANLDAIASKGRRAFYGH